MKRIPMVYMRGGAAKGVFFHEEDLPENIEDRTSLLLKVMGSPDPQQIDGMGGGTSATSKVVSVKKSNRQDAVIEYTVCLVSVQNAKVEYSSLCGSISNAVAPFAVDEGLVDISENEVEKTVRMFNVNTGTIIVSDIEMDNGRARVNGNCEIGGVPGKGSGVRLAFRNPAGTKTGKLFPTGNKVDRIESDAYGDFDVTIIDATTPLIIMRAGDLDLEGIELPKEIAENMRLMETLEEIRGIVAEKLGFAKDRKKTGDLTRAIPKICFVSSPKTYETVTGSVVEEGDMDICVRMLSMGSPHNTAPLTGALALSAACFIYDTIAYEFSRNREAGKVVVGHPSGVFELFPRATSDGFVEEVSTISTARRIVDGYVYINEG